MMNHSSPNQSCEGQSFIQTVEGKAITISLLVGIVIVFIKTGAFMASGSLAMMADMLESLVHNLAVGFAVYCLWLSHRPADDNHLYGHGKSQFLSAGVEGSLVCGAGLLILISSFRSYWSGYQLLDVRDGILLSSAAGVVNAVLAGWLIQTGKKRKSIILVANGKHILSDVVTTGAALIGLLAAWLFDWIYLDLLAAVVGGLYIMIEGLKLLRDSVGGLLDEANREVDQTLRHVLDVESDEHDISYHKLRHRSEGNKHWMELHLVMEDDMSLQKAHDLASHLEAVIRESLPEPITITTHLEPKSSQEDNDAISDPI